MAETILYNTVTEILKKLGSSVLQEIGLVSVAGNELDKLKDTISTIRAILVHAEELQSTNPEVEDWLEKLNDAFYDADDLLDDFSTKVLRRQVKRRNKRLKKLRRQITTQNNKKLKKVRNFFSSSNQFAFSSKMANAIKAIRERLDAIAEDRKKFHLIEKPIDMRVENTKREETHSFVHAGSVIGRNSDKMALVELLLDNNVQENVSVVALVGIGGLGKTTLAQLVYNDERVKKYFELKMWVCISDVFDVQLSVEKIIESATGRKPENLSMDKLQEKLRREIDGNKYLLVLDDVWNEDREKWLKLRDLLLGGSRGSKILVTTRSELVATVVTDSVLLYHLKGLSEEASWSLFKQLAFKQGKENPCRLTMGREIVQKCKGVPLAIRAIGSLLYSKDTDVEWLVFKNNDLSKIAQKEDVVLPTLKLSYNCLPSYLKRCFVFCSLYLKDEKIRKKELIQLWIAHGFIQPLYGNQQLEDVGDLYFMELLRRSFFQDVEMDQWGEVISCKMHELVHDLAESIVRPKSSIVNANAENITESTRHLSLDSCVNLSGEMSTHLVRAHKLRTLKSPKVQVSNKSVFEKIVSTFKSLHVLDLSHSGTKTVPNNIGKLKHLRYLDLSDSCISTLPSSITKLQNLQTLKLNDCVNLEEWPRDFKKLISLRHLELDNCPSLPHMSSGLGQLTSLSTLTRFVADSNSLLSELYSLNNLRGRLSIIILGREGSSSRWCLKNTTVEEGRMERTNYLEAKEYLKTLELCFYRNDDDELLLEFLRPHRNLKQLMINFYDGVVGKPLECI
ncbi:putative disease resistance protein RGA4 [Cornus florida]|uniref:putative disease resistance protein RGA4 n=1 Tax=Cornus florida TaxID=4283 RepID=UPI002897A5C5|nr:putative disease resistance protein RGA4 [Cornus florida]